MRISDWSSDVCSSDLLTRTDQGLDVLIEGIEADGLAAAEGLTAFAQRHNLARLAIYSGYGPEARWEPGPVTITLGGVPVSFPQIGIAPRRESVWPYV